MDKKAKSKRDDIISLIKSKYIRSYFKKYKYQYLLGVIILIGIDILQLRIPLIIGSATDGLESQTIGIDGVFYYVKTIAFIGVIVAVGRFGWRNFIFGTSRKVEYDIRNDLFKHLESLSLRYFNENKTGEIMAHMTNDLNAVRMAVGPGIFMICDTFAVGLLALVNMYTQIDVKLTLLALIPLSFITITVAFLGKELHKRFKNKQEAFAKMSDFTQENISGIKVIKAFVQEVKEIEAFEDINKNNYNKNINLLKLYTIMRPYMRAVSGIAIAITIGYGGYITILNRITLGQFVAFVQYLGLLVWPMMAVGMAINVISMGSASLERIEKILDEKVEINDSKDVKGISEIDGNIKVNNLSFKYPNSEEYALKNISFEINKGQTLGIVGRTGSGKTTLTNLFLRLFDPDKGTVFISGYDILDIPLKTLRKNIGYVPQDNFLFSNTISNNIDFGVRNSSEEKIINYAKSAQVHENIVEFKHGYDTIVGERGVTLSGGQKQRVSIARALIKEPEILILDDSVSAVDTDTEERILSHLKEERKGKTNIIIAHRISTIQNADLIIVIDDNKLIEKGTHEELLENKKLYRDLYEKQLLEKALEEA